MALVLAVAAVLICTVRTLRPETLTPIIENVANSALDARVSLGRAELAFRPGFPLLELRLDSLKVISRSFDTLDPEERAQLPEYADSLFSLASLRGGIDLGKFFRRGEIAITDVVLTSPEMNIVLAADGRGNFDIYSSADTASASSATVLPPISIRRFRMESPRAIRYFDAIDSTEATVVLLASASLDGSDAPSYALSIDGRLSNPAARQLLNLRDLRFGFDGRLRWDPRVPDFLALDDFNISGASLQAKVDMQVRFGESLSVDTASFELRPVRVDSLLAFLPDSVRARAGLVAPNFETDAVVSITAHTTGPFVPARDTVPNIEASVVIPESRLRYGQTRLHDVALDLSVALTGTDYDRASATLRRLTFAGPATSVEISGRFSRLISDPTFDCRVDGDMQLANLPRVLTDKLQGILRGRLKMNIEARGSASMFELGKFHRLDVRGEAIGTELYFLDRDTSRYVRLGRAEFRFGSRYRGNNPQGTPPALAVSLKVDTAHARVGGVGMDLGGLVLGMGLENTGRSADSLTVVPMGGIIRIGSFRALSIRDSAGCRVRGLEGRVSLARHEGDRYVPEISLDAQVRRLVAGAPLARVNIREAHLSALTYLRPDRVRGRQYQRRHHRRHMTEMADSNEIIDFGVSRGFAKYLNNWYLGGELTTRRASLYTPYFPIRNRLSRANLRFNNDSIVLEGLRYRAGHSNLELNGLISNVRRSLTGRRHTPLKMNFSVQSDTLDINELAAAVFAGSAYAERRRRGMAPDVSLADDADDDAFSAAIESNATSSDSTLAAILIPVNIDASVRLNANHILYSDFQLQDFSGNLLVYDGAVNLNHLTASSDAGTVGLSALYAAPNTREMRAGLGLQLEKFDIERFLRLVPAVDSLMPLMRDFSGIINADIAATVDLDSAMNMELPTLDAAVRLSGHDLAFIDPETYRTIGKWLRFRDKADNRIDSMSVQMLVSDNQMQIFPFQFNIDRYTLGVIGSNDLNMNFNYHISVLKSPLPFKFGVNIKGNPDNYKVRLGGAKYKPGMAAERLDMVDTVRVNLIDQIQNVFRRGVRNSRFARLNSDEMRRAGRVRLNEDTLSREDSLILVNQGIIQ